MKIKNWSDFQHFKDRNPPWIKFYKTLLERRDIAVISDRNYRILTGLWLLASEDKTMQGNLPDMPQIAFRLRRSEKEINQSIQGLSDFLIQDDSAVISPVYQDDVPETEAETYKEETEIEADPLSGKPDPKEILNYLNLKSNHNYQLTPKHLKCINSRIKEGYTFADFTLVVDNMVSKWGNDGEMMEYLRPITLFSPKFDSYLNQPKALAKKHPSGIQPREGDQLNPRVKDLFQQWQGEGDDNIIKLIREKANELAEDSGLNKNSRNVLDFILAEPIKTDELIEGTG